MAITNTQLAIYQSDGTTLTRLVQTAPAASGLWDTANTVHRTAPTVATQTLYPGIDYFVGLFVQAGTAGTHAGWGTVANTFLMTSAEVAVPPMYTKGSETATAASYAISALTATYTGIPFVGITDA